ncbi:MAG: cytochrome P450 [Rhodoferax sp.]|nr:cytochrome P450 [Rhodoferax sp.]
MYDEGAVIMADVLLVLHGAEHRARRLLELKVFRRDFFRYYEHQVFPETLRQTMRPFVERGSADLMDLGYRVTMNLTADFAGIDRPDRTSEETARLLALVMTFSEGATLVHSTRDKDAVRAEVRLAMRRFDEQFYQPSLARRRALVDACQRGAVPADSLPRDVLTVLVANEDRIELPPEVMMREIAFYLQAGSHSTANATVHAFHDLTVWRQSHPEDGARMDRDPLFLQRCVHESLRLHPASPVAWRKPVCPMHLPTGQEVGDADRVVIDLAQANCDPDVFGDDAQVFNPHRRLPDGVPPWGLTFGVGVHTCLGRDLDGGVLPRADTDPQTHQYGIVPLFVQSLFEQGARLDPERKAVPASHTERPNWGAYPIVFGDRS